MPLPNPPMTHVSYANLRQNLSRYLDEVVNLGSPIVVTRRGGKNNVVMISAAEFAGWQETVHLLSSPKNAERLFRGVRETEAGQDRMNKNNGDAASRPDGDSPE